MALTFVISGPLRALAGDRGEVRLDAEATSLAKGLEALWACYPSFRDRVVTEMGELRPHLNIFVDGESIRETGGFSTPLRSGSEVVILPALSGG